MNRERWQGLPFAPGWGLLGALLLLACEAPQEEGRPAPDGTGSPSSAMATRFELAEPPLFDVAGGASEDGAQRWTYEPFGSLVVAILPPGDMVVGNGDHLVFLDTLGRPRAIAGRPGRGPGEFEQVERVFAADSIVVAWDSVLDRVSFWSESGEHLGGLAFREEFGAEVVGWIPGVGAVSRARNPLPVGAPIEYSVRGLDGRVEHALEGPVRNPTLSVRTTVGTPRRTIGLPCSPRVLDAVVATTLLSVDPVGAQVYAIPLSGSMRGIYVSEERPTVGSGHLERLDRLLLGSDVPRRTRRQAARMFGRPGDPLPSNWTGVVGDPTGRIWLRVARCLSATPGSAWEIISSGGEPIGVLETPYYVVAARGDLVAAMSIDSLGVRRIGLHRLVPVRPAASP